MTQFTSEGNRMPNARRFTFGFIGLLLFLCSFSLQAQRRLDLSNYQLVWSDEFDDYSDDRQTQLTQLFDLPTSKWINGNVYDGPASALSGSVWDFATHSIVHHGASRSMVSITKDPVTHNGYLTLKAHHFEQGVSNYVDPAGDTRYYTDSLGQQRSIVDFNGQTIYGLASILTANYSFDYPCQASATDQPTYGFNYGIFEIRAKLPRRMHDLCSFYLWNSEWQCGDELGTDPNNPNDYHCNAYGRCTVINPMAVCGNLEMDVLNFAVDNTTLLPSASPGYYSTSIKANYKTPEQCRSCDMYHSWQNEDPTNTYHVYTFGWYTNGLYGSHAIWFIDGVEVKIEDNGVPKFLENLVFSYIAGDEHKPNDDSEFSIDYVRVYKPIPNAYANVTYAAMNNYQHGVPGPDYHRPVVTNWNDYNDPARTDPYLKAYEEPLYYDPHFGYRNYTPDTTVVQDSPINDYFSGGQVGPMTYGVVAAQPSGQQTLYYTNAGSDLLKSIDYLPFQGLSTSGHFQFYYFANSAYSNANIIAQDVERGSKIDMDHATGSLFYRTPGHSLQIRYWNNTAFYTDKLGTHGEPDNVEGEITTSPAFSAPTFTSNGKTPAIIDHSFRVYYVDANHHLWYYEWIGAFYGWQLHESGIQNVKQDLVVAENTGQLFYEGTDGAVYVSTAWFSAGGFQSVAISNPSQTPYYETASYLSQHLVTNRDGSCVGFVVNKKRSFYALPSEGITAHYANNSWPTHFENVPEGQLYQLIRKNTSSYSHPEYDLVATGVTDVSGAMKILKNYNGEYEIFYINTHGKTKTYYQRRGVYDIHHPGQLEWMQATLEVFSKYPMQSYAHAPITCSHSFLALSYDNTPTVALHGSNGDSYPLTGVAPLVFFQQSNLRFGAYRFTIADFMMPGGRVCDGNNFPEQYKTDEIQFRQVNTTDYLAANPNPSDGHFRVLLKGSHITGNVSMINIVGQKVLTQAVDGHTTIDLDCSSCPKGMYILEWESEGSRKTTKLVID